MRVLYLEDSQDDVDLLKHALVRQGFDVVARRVDTEPDFLDALSEGGWDVVLSDHSMPGFSSLRALGILRERGFDWPFIVVSGTISEEAAVAAMRSGAQDYVLKGNLTRLVPAIRRELAEADNRRLKRKAEAALVETERQLRQAQKMEAVGRLAAGVAHDFNNVLTVIMAFSQMVLEDLPPDSEQRDAVQQIREAAERATQMTRQLLSFSRQGGTAPSHVRMDELMTRLRPLLERLLGEDVEMGVQVIGTPAPVFIDPGHFEQVIMNLVVNARDAMPGGGLIGVRLSAADVDPALAATLGVEPGPHVVCEVADTGHGMDEDTRTRAFEPFFTTKPQGRGTGLGLSTVFDIVRQCRGGIAVESVLGEGTTFRLYFPAAPAIEVAPEPAPADMPDLHGTETVLVVEDEPGVRKLVTAALSRAGYNVLEARSASQALSLAEDPSLAIDLLVSDVVMPGESGPQLASALQSRFPALPVLFMCGYAEHASLAEGLSLPRSALLRKPFLGTELLAAVRQSLGTTPAN